MAPRSITKTWWGEKWLDALNGVYYTNRIGRGKTYANTGRVYDVTINHNLVQAKVRGNYMSYYDVSVEFKEFSPTEKSIILQTFYENPSLMSALLNRKLPKKVYELLKYSGVNVFPTSHRDIRTSCDCPDYAAVCKHIAGVVYVIAMEIDKDPFLIFRLRGLDLLEALNLEIECTTIKDVCELFSNADSPRTDALDFSRIPNLHTQIFQLLDKNPVFYTKDFRAILDTVYRSAGRFAKRSCENYTRQRHGTYEHFSDVGFMAGTFSGDEDDYEDWLEEVFLKRWGMPNRWEKLRLNLKGDYTCEITTDRDCPIENESFLFGFFAELGESSITKYSPDIRFLNLIYQFSLELIKKHAIIPEIFKSGNEYQIRWIPAIFDKEISAIIDVLTGLCPDDVIIFDNARISKKDQVIAGVSIFIKGFFEEYIRTGASQPVRLNYNRDVFQLFFMHPLSFEWSPTTPEAISQWLSKFQINSRDYDLYLLVEETPDGFEVDICVNDGMESIHEVIEKTEDSILKTNLIKDTYIINEIYPKFNDTLSLNENLELNLDDFTTFFLNTLPLFEVMGLKIILPKSLRKILRPKLKLEVTVNQNEQSYITFNDLTGFNWEVAIGKTTCSPKEFKSLAEKSRGIVKIANEFVMLDERDVKSLIKQIDRLPEKLNRHELTKAILSGKALDGTAEVEGDFSGLIENITKISDVDVPPAVNADLRDYQKRGYSWLVQNIKSGFGSILADDMGLGKTLQVLATIQHLKDEGYLEGEKVLVIAPTSLLTNWQEEIRRFTPELTSYIFHGTRRRFTKKKYDIYLTSYGIIRSDIEKFKRQKWFLTVIDEAQNIKNPEAKQTKAVKSIKARHRIAMSGTPVENRLAEYWSIFDFTNKGYLSSLKKFRQSYIIPIEKEKNQNTLNNFKEITRPFILRRLKSDKNIINDLPDKIVNDIYCDLTKEQVALYKETLDSSMAEVEANAGIKRKGLVLKLINSLKQICNHPSQFTKSSMARTEESGKMEVLMHTLENILRADEKAIIFTQYVQMGEIIKRLAEEKFGEEVLFLHGSLRREKRDDMITRFQTSHQSRIFIISLKAGGTGLNLTAAQNVIHYDLWWNPAVENQATDRAYRIGQRQNVIVYRFITKGTFEEKINEMIQSKEELAKLTVGDGEAFITEMDTKDLENMLKLRR